MVSLAASLAMVDRTFSVAIRFSVWLVTCDCECSNFRSVEEIKSLTIKLSSFSTFPLEVCYLHCMGTNMAIKMNIERGFFWQLRSSRQDFLPYIFAYKSVRL